MLKIVEVKEVACEGFDKLVGERITVYCGNYIYTGRLVGINKTCILLSEAAVVYETGPYCEKKWKDAQNLPGDWYVQLGWIESFGVLK